MTKPPADQAREIFVMNNRSQQEAALKNCENEKQVRYCLNVFRERRKVCQNLKIEFWL